MGKLRIEKLTLVYDQTPIIKDLSLQIEDGELVSLLGPSGAGKTTILKAIAGLLSPASGEIFIDNQLVTHLPAEKRDAVLIFQKPLLFPFLNVEQNIGFGLKMAHITGMNAEKKIDRIIEITGLDDLNHRKVHQLSGGQQQRVALARGLVLEPSVLLLDEPLSNLDADLRHQMRELICTIQKRTGTTMLFVTHDQSEALKISDRIGLLQEGILQQLGSPKELFYQPNTPEVASFFGSANVFSGSIAQGVFKSTAVCLKTGQKDSSAALAVIRPEDIHLTITPSNELVKGKISHIRFEGTNSRIAVQTSDTVFTIFAVRPELTLGQTVWLHFPSQRVHIFPKGL